MYLKNENDLGEMISIMDSLHRYVPHVRRTTTVVVPGTEEHETSIRDYLSYMLFGGDQ